jgi:hypothetical protein
MAKKLNCEAALQYRAGSSNTIVLISTGFRANSFCRSVIALDDNQLNTEFIKELYLQTPFRRPTTQAKLWMVFVLARHRTAVAETAGFG